MKPKSFEQWCKDNGRLTPATGSDRVWRAHYEAYRVKHFRDGVAAILANLDKGGDDDTA